MGQGLSSMIDTLIDVDTYRIKNTIGIPNGVNCAYIHKACLSQSCKHRVFFYKDDRLVLHQYLSFGQLQYILRQCPEIKIEWERRGKTTEWNSRCKQFINTNMNI